MGGGRLTKNVRGGDLDFLLSHYIMRTRNEVEETKMMQGDSYGLPIELLKADGSVLTADDVLEVEGAVGSLVKTYTDGGMTFSSSENKWKMLLSQEETLKLPNASLKAQVRVKLKDGSVHGISLGTIRVLESISKVVL